MCVPLVSYGSANGVPYVNAAYERDHLTFVRSRICNRFVPTSRPEDVSPPRRIFHTLRSRNGRAIPAGSLIRSEKPRQFLYYRVTYNVKNKTVMFPVGSSAKPWRLNGRLLCPHLRSLRIETCGNRLCVYPMHACIRCRSYSEYRGSSPDSHRERSSFGALTKQPQKIDCAKPPDITIWIQY